MVGNHTLALFDGGTGLALTPLVTVAWLAVATLVLAIADILHLAIAINGAPGPVAVAALRKGAEAHAISWRTVERAKKLVGVEARRVSSGTAARGVGHWEWFLELVEPAEEEQP